MTRGGARTDRSDPERRCVVTGAAAGKDGLIRFVLGPEGEIVPDLAERLPGRGLWVAADRALLDPARARRAFARAARRSVEVPADLAERVEALLARRLIELLAMARKAGAVVFGFDRVRVRLRAGPVAALIEAADGAANGKAKLRPLAGDVARIDCLTAEELGLAFGRDHVIHAALDEGGIADRVLREARRLAGLRRKAAVQTPTGDGAGAMAIRTDDRWRTE